MITREVLVNKTEKLLEKSGFDFCSSSGCFDIAAKKKTTMLIKILVNIDAFQQSQSNNLAILSDYISANQLLIGFQTRTEKLKENIIYERFGTPTVNTETFENMLFNEMPVLFRKRGGLYANISASSLREAREEKSLSQSQLAKKVGITKKNIYEHEAGDMPAAHETVVKLERVLSRKITNPAAMLRPEPVYRSPGKNSFEQRVSMLLKNLGFSAHVVQKTRFNVVAKKEKSLIITAEKNAKRVESDKKEISSFSRVVGTPFVIVTQGEAQSAIDIKELSLLSSKQLMKRAKGNS